jgi:hypothetical protein
MNEKLDLNNKSNWTMENAQEIADELGFVSDEDFKNNLALFITTTVDPASMPNFLRVIAAGFFNKCKQEKTKQSLL